MPEIFATSHLLAQGYRRIAHLAGPQHLSIYHQRRRGYLAAYGCAQREEMIHYSGMTVAEDAHAMSQFMARPVPPDAVFGAGDSVVLGALRAAKSLGIRVPQEVALAGFSNEGFTTITEPPLTSVDQRYEEMDEAVVRLFLGLAAAATLHAVHQQIVLQPNLFIRQSSLWAGPGPAGGHVP